MRDGRLGICSVPGGDAGNDARDVTFVLGVVFTEAVRELGFFDQWDVGQIDEYEHERPDEVGGRLEQGGFREEDEHYAGDHWVAHVSVWAAHDKRSGRVPGGERAAALRGEMVERCAEQHEAERKKRRTEDGRRDTGERDGGGQRNVVAICDPGRDYDGHHKGQSGDGDEVTKDGEEQCHLESPSLCAVFATVNTSGILAGILFHIRALPRIGEITNY